MRNVRIPPKTQWSIFGDTYGGVPNPNTVLVHGYPTRYHGPNFTVPQQGYGYRLRPYARAPFLGIEGLGQFEFMEHRVFTAIVGGLAGVLAAPNKKSQIAYVGIGALAGALIGNVGTTAVIAAAAGSRLLNAPLPEIEVAARRGSNVAV